MAPCSQYYGCKRDGLCEYARDGRVVFVQCGACGLIWRDLAACDEERVFDGSYFRNKGYDRARAHKVRKSHMIFAIIEQFARPGRLLEVGPAMGYSMEAAVRRGWSADGLDVSEHAIEFLKSAGLRCWKGNLMDTSSVAGRYDAILMKHVFEHYRDPFAALKRAGEMLVDRGLIAIVVPNAAYRKAGRLRGRHKFYCYQHNGIEHFVYFNQQTLRRIVEFGGFEVLQEGLPVFVKGDNAPASIANRAVRRAMAVARLDQEIFLFARKAG